MFRGIMVTAVAVAIAVVMASSTAHAGDWTLTESGTISSIVAFNLESDPTPGPAPSGEIKVGDAFTVSAIIDLSDAQLSSAFAGNPTVSIYTLPDAGVVFKAVTYTDGFTTSIDGTTVQLWNNNSVPPSVVDSESFSFFNDPATNFPFNLGAGVTVEGLDLDAFDFTATARSNDAISEIVPLSAFGAKTFSYVLLNATTNESIVADGTVTAEVLSAAPEPEAWLLMIAGAGLIGALLRLDRSRGLSLA